MSKALLIQSAHFARRVGGAAIWSMIVAVNRAVALAETDAGHLRARLEELPQAPAG